MDLEEDVCVKAQSPGTPRGSGARGEPAQSCESGGVGWLGDSGELTMFSITDCWRNSGFEKSVQGFKQRRGRIHFNWLILALMLEDRGRPGDHLEVVREIHCSNSSKR